MRPASLTWLAAAALVLAHFPAPQPVAAADSNRGELLFRDAFNDTIAEQWTMDRPEAWQIVNGRLRATLPNEKQVRSLAYAGTDRWRDYVIDLDVCGVRGVDKGIVVRIDGESRGVGFDLRGGRYNDIVLYRGYESWARTSVANRNGVWYHVRIEVQRNHYRAFVDGERVIDFADDSNSRPRGRFALAAYTGGVGACEILFDNVEVRALK
jgi:hypothetical protein